MSNELATPKLVACPSDSERTAHTNFNWYTGFSKGNVSYGFGADLDEGLPSMVMTLDRNAGPCASGAAPTSLTIYKNFVMMGTNAPTIANNNIGWSETQLHMKAGNVLLADGSVQQPSFTRLSETLKNSGDTSHAAENGIPIGANRAWFPN
jgi:prepilin-type processing-associated H-X9-DG protein